MLPTKIVLIGAGSASFGLNTLGALLRCELLHGSQIALVDKNPEALGLMKRLAERMNREWDAQVTITSHTHHIEALDGAGFVVSAIEVPPRERLWRSDYEIPLKYGVRQPYAENGGPGGLAHALRNIPPVLEIAHEMEKQCPDAWYINYTNPMVRICDAIARYSKIKVVGLCHQIKAGYGMVGYVLAKELGIRIPEGIFSTHASPEYWELVGRIVKQALEKIDIEAAGLNHFTWMLNVHDRRSGEDLYPVFAKRFAELDPSLEPLTQRVYRSFGCFPIPGDSHLCEYLPWLSDPVTKPWEKYHIQLYNWEQAEKGRKQGYEDIAKMGSGSMGIDQLKDSDSEGALEMITNVAGGGNHFHIAVNLPNHGQIENLPQGAMVETPGWVSGAGIKGVAVGRLPQGVAELCRRELEVVRLCVDAAANGDRQAALQALLLDPVITDLDVAQQVLDDYLIMYKKHLPQFWNS